MNDPGETRPSESTASLRRKQPTRWWRSMLLCGRKPKKPRKPPSNPPGWTAGTATEYDIAKSPNRVIVINGEQETEFSPNMVRTSKYKLYSFLPIFLWEEFNPTTKIANVYFIFIAVLQVIPAITNTFGIPLMLLPLFFVVFVDAVFMIIEDIARHRADNFANSSSTWAWDRHSGAFKVVTWKEIEVGDLIVINNREAIPCDVLIVGVDEPSPETPAGIAYVETKSLDGETNLKIRQVVKGTLGALQNPEDCAKLHGRVVMEHPDKLINNFKGKLILNTAKRTSSVFQKQPSSSGAMSSACGEKGVEKAATDDGYTQDFSGEEVTDPNTPDDRRTGASDVLLQGATSEPIAPDMLLLRGCVLRNTRWVVGLVLNTGLDTKIMMSMSEAPSKASHLSKRINEEIKRVAAVMGVVCLIGAVAGTVWNAKFLDDKWYLSWEGDGHELIYTFFTQLFYYALLLNSFIPISLYVSMNFVRFLQSWFMNQDLDIYYAPADTPARVRTMNLNEDLGQVSHIFSDKTGTLTCNIMDFRKFSVGEMSYGLGITEIGRAAVVVEGGTVPADVLAAEEKAKKHVAPHVNFYDPSAYRDLMGKGSGGEAQVQRIRDFFMALAVCHTVIPEKFEDTDEVILSASSPDDEALVLGAKYFGFEFAGRVNSNAVINTWAVKKAPDALPSTPRRIGMNSPQNKSPRGGRRASLFPGTFEQPFGRPQSPPLDEAVADDPGTPALLSPHTRRGRSGSVFAILGGVRSGGCGSGGGAAEEKSGGGTRSRNSGSLSPKFRRSGSVGALMAAATRGFGGGDRLKLQEVGPAVLPERPVVTPVNFEVLHLLGFTSDRKRMSVIVRTEDGTIKIICKGADTVMLPRLRTDYPHAKEFIDATVKHMDTFAKEGLRTLVIAQAELDPEAYEQWADQYEEASSDLVEIDKKNRGEANRIESIMDLVECNLEIIGSSAIEDKLQEGVAEAVSDLMAAGIKIWVLTGDKEETAINIAVACQLLWTEQRMRRTVINLRDTGSAQPDEIKHALEDFLEQFINERDMFEQDTTGTLEPPLPRGLVIDGPALLEALQTPESQCALLRAAQACHCVVGCRMSPDQKRALVSLVRENVPGTRTLSIGDGANDVPMIQTAHIGVGISGQEGMQAVNASDYAISQFAYLRKLLLVHGRWNYRRSSRVVCYLFYKSIMFAGPLVFYASFNGFSGTLFYDYVTTNLYAVVYTALPILLYGTYDQDISARTCLRFPQLYAYGIQDGYMRPKIFWSWMLQALLESSFITVMPLILLSGDRNQMGVVTSTYEYGTTTFALVVITVSLKMFWVQCRWTPIHILALLGSVLAYFLSAFVVNTSVVLNWDYHGVLDSLVQSGLYWAVSVWCLVVVIGRDWAWKFHHRWWNPRLHHLVIESEHADQYRNEPPLTPPILDNSTSTAPVTVAGGKVSGAAAGRGGLTCNADRLEMGRDLKQGPHTSFKASPVGSVTSSWSYDSSESAKIDNIALTTTKASTVAFKDGQRSMMEFLNSNSTSPVTIVATKTNTSPTAAAVGSGSDSLTPRRLPASPTDTRPITIDALAENLQELKFAHEHRRNNSNVSHGRAASAANHSGDRRRETRGSGSGSSGGRGRGREGGRWGRSVGWIDSLLSPTGERTGGLSPSVVGGRGGGRGRGGRAEEGVGSPSVAVSLERQKSQARLQVGDLGRDPREAAKLMSKHSFFVEVDGITSAQALPASSTPTGLLLRSVSARRGSSRSGSASTISGSSPSGSRRATMVAQANPVRPTALEGIEATNKHLSTSESSRRRASAVHPNKSCHSHGGFAFSCDPQAQKAEIAMILGHRPSPMKHTAGFYEHRSSLRAQRIGRARVSGGSGVLCDILAERDEELGGGHMARIPLQRRNSYTVGAETLGTERERGGLSSSRAKVNFSRTARQYESSTTSIATTTNSRAEAGGVGGVADEWGAVTGVSSLQALHLIVEESFNDPGMGGTSNNRSTR